MNLLSEHNRILRVGEGGGGIEYSAGPNIDITNHVISGRDWSNDIDAAVMSGISSTSGDIVNEAYNQSTAWVDEQGYLTAHQDVSNLPYVQNSALGYNGNLVSSISGDGFFAESANNAYHSDDSYHADYADNANSAEYAESAGYTELADSAHVADYAVTAESAYGLVNGYSGIAPIVVDNEHMLISAQSAVLGVQDPLYFVEDTSASTVIGIHDSAFPTFEGTEDGKISAINGSALNADPIIPYSGGSNISVDNYIISVTGSVPSADRTDYAVSATSSHFSHSAIEAGSANYATESNHTHSADSATYDSLGRKIVDTYLTAHQDWTPTIQNASSNAYNSAVNWVVDQHYLTAVTGDNTPYSAGANISINDHVISGKDWTSEIQAASANAAAQIPTGVMVTSALEYDSDNHYITAYNGSAIGKEETEYSAGANISIQNHVISGKDWTTDIQNASSYAVNQATAQIPDVTNLDYVQNTALNIDNGSITSISSYNVGHPQVPVSGESGIYLTKKSGTVYIGYSGAGGGGQGVEYTGIAPIVVNNVEHKISAQSAKLGVQSPLYFVEDSTTATVIGFSGGSDFPESADQACKTVTANSANWNNAYNSARSGYAASAYLRNSVTANVSNWNSCRATVYNNSAKWGDIPTKVVANSSLATGSNILYIVTGS